MLNKSNLVTPDQQEKKLFSTAETVELLLEPAAKSAQADPVVRDFAVWALGQAGRPKDAVGQMTALSAGVRNAVWYVDGPLNVQQIVAPPTLLLLPNDQRVGNCADQATLLAAAALSIGLQACFVRIAADSTYLRTKPADPYHHVVVGLVAPATDVVWDPTTPELMLDRRFGHQYHHALIGRAAVPGVTCNPQERCAFVGEV